MFLFLNLLQLVQSCNNQKENGKDTVRTYREPFNLERQCSSSNNVANNTTATVRLCGWRGFSRTDCDRAGCCYRDNLCFVRSNPLDQTYNYYPWKTTFTQAYQNCNQHGSSLLCLRDITQLPGEVINMFCGEIWITNGTTEACSQPKQPSLLSNNPRYNLTQTLENTSLVLPYICYKEHWKPHIITPLHNIKDTDEANLFQCALRYDELKGVWVKWTYMDKNGVKTEYSTQSLKRSASGIYTSSFSEAKNIGAYRCIFMHQNSKGAIQEVHSWAYKYTDISCTVTVNQKTYAARRGEEVTREARVGENVNITVTCHGYPTPYISVAPSSTSQPIPRLKEVASPATSSANETKMWVLESFGRGVKPEVVYEVNLKVEVLSVIEKLEPLKVNIRITKEPTPISCDTKFKNENAYLSTLLQTMNISSFPRENISISIACTGYPLPIINATRSIHSTKVTPMDEWKPPKLSNKLTIIVENFAAESFWDDYSEEYLVTASSQGNLSLQIRILIRKVLIMFNKAKRREVTPDGVVKLGCQGKGVEPLDKTTASWIHNNKILDLSKLGKYVRFTEPENSTFNADLEILLKSPRVSGNFTCVIDNGAAHDHYSEIVSVKMPPLPPATPYIKQVNFSQHTITAKALTPSSWPFSNVSSVWGILYSNGLEVQRSNRTERSSDLQSVDVTFDGLNMSDLIGKNVSVALAAANSYGESALSDRSDDLLLNYKIPEASPSSVHLDSVPRHNRIRVSFPKVVNATSYEGTLFTVDLELVARVKGTGTTLQFDDLDSETEYLVAVRGVREAGEGTLVYGPFSRKVVFMTSPMQIPSPTKLAAINLQNNDEGSVVLLTWEPPQAAEGFVTGYILQVKQVDTTSTRTRRQALQIIPISYGSRAYLLRNLRPGLRYKFLLQCQSTHGRSPPVQTEVLTRNTDHCPLVRVRPRLCPPRYSVDGVTAFIRTYTDCFIDAGYEYSGETAVSITGRTCMVWPAELVQKTPQLGQNNFCRNFEGSGRSKPWCYVEDGKVEDCLLKSCRMELEYDVHCFTGRGYDYRGFTNVGYGNIKCRPWSQALLDKEGLRDVKWDPNDKNYCRNWNGSEMTSPWCITKSGFKSQCDVDTCGWFETQYKAQNGSDKSLISYNYKWEFNDSCIKLTSKLDDTIFSVKQIFEAKDCDSEVSHASIQFQGTKNFTDKFWVRYFALQFVMAVVVGVLWGFLICRKNEIEKGFNNRKWSNGYSKKTCLSSVTLRNSSSSGVLKRHAFQRL